MTPNFFTVTSSPAGIAYDETQLLKSIFECIDAVVYTEVRDGEDVSSIPEPEKLTKGESIA